MPTPRFVATAVLGIALLTALAVDAAPARRRRALAADRAREPIPTPAVELGRRELGDRDALPLRSQGMSIEIDGQHARTVSNLEYENVLDGRLEGSTVIDVGNAARVTGFSYYVGSERIVGEVLPKTTAREIYEDTVGRRRDPALVEELAPGRFSLDVFPIEPGEHKRVQIEWAQWLEQHAGEVSYRTPLADPRAELVIVLEDERGIAGLRSSTHDLKVTRDGTRTRVSARPRKTTARALELRWRIAAPPMRLHGWVHRDEGDDGYVLLHVAAPPAERTARVAKDVTLVIDESASMEGEALDNAKLAAREIVNRLDATDRVNVVLFDDRVESLFGKPKPADADVRAKARRFIDGAGEGSGTDIALALKTAIAKQGSDARPKTVLLLTDGHSPREPVFAAVASDKSDVRLFTIGVGDGVDDAVLQRLAADKRGRYTAIRSASELRVRVAGLFDRMQAPVFVGLELESDGPTLLRKYPDALPDLFAGDELVIAARVQGDGELTVRLRGTTSKGARTLVQTLRIPTAAQRPWVGAQWAGARIGDLLTRLELEQDDRDERIEEITRLGVAYDIVTPYTSMLAIPESELTARTRELLVRGRKGEHVGRSFSMEEFRNIPIGNPNSRDFTDVVESSATADADSSGISLAGTTAAESRGAIQTAQAPRAGCAHCAVDDRGASATWLLMAVALLVRRRRA